MSKVRAHVFVRGYVQGVFFRSSTRDFAESLELGGWVKNNRDGRVEIVFEGEKESVDRAIAFVREGPEYARVDDVQVEYEDYTGEFSFFSIVR